jgi:hypothetical protein
MFRLEPALPFKARLSAAWPAYWRQSVGFFASMFVILLGCIAELLEDRGAGTAASRTVDYLLDHAGAGASALIVLTVFASLFMGYGARKGLRGGPVNVSETLSPLRAVRVGLVGLGWMLLTGIPLFIALLFILDMPGFYLCFPLTFGLNLIAYSYVALPRQVRLLR